MFESENSSPNVPYPVDVGRPYHSWFNHSRRATERTSGAQRSRLAGACLRGAPHDGAPESPTREPAPGPVARGSAASIRRRRRTLRRVRPRTRRGGVPQVPMQPATRLSPGCRHWLHGLVEKYRARRQQDRGHCATRRIEQPAPHQVGQPHGSHPGERYDQEDGLYPADPGGGGHHQRQPRRVRRNDVSGACGRAVTKRGQCRLGARPRRIASDRLVDDKLTSRQQQRLAHIAVGVGSTGGPGAPRQSHRQGDGRGGGCDPWRDAGAAVPCRAQLDADPREACPPEGHACRSRGYADQHPWLVRADEHAGDREGKPAARRHHDRQHTGRSSQYQQRSIDCLRSAAFRQGHHHRGCHGIKGNRRAFAAARLGGNVTSAR